MVGNESKVPETKVFLLAYRTCTFHVLGKVVGEALHGEAVGIGAAHGAFLVVVPSEVVALVLDVEVFAHVAGGKDEVGREMSVR